MTTKVGRLFFQPQMIGTTQQHQEHTDQVEHLTFRDGHVAFLREHRVDLRDRPTFPEAPVANLRDDFQGKTTTAYCQVPGFLGSVDPFPPSTFRIGATISEADDEVAPAQKDNVLSSDGITAFQDLTATRAGRLRWSKVTLGNITSIFRFSHRYTSLARSLRMSQFYHARAV